MTKLNNLTHLKTQQLPSGKYFDGQGLILVKSRKDAGKWILRFVIDGKRREMGLGRWPDVTIKEARETAAEARKKVRRGIDPILERKKQSTQPDRLIVESAIKSCFEAKKAELKNDGEAGRWMSPLKVHVIPKIGRKPIEDIDQHELKRLLDPIWHTKPEAARKALNRIHLTLNHAAALGLDVDLQAVMKARALLGKQRHTANHIPSVPYPEAPAFYQWLCTKTTISAFALRFLILTIARTSEVRFATYDEIDDNVWVLEPHRTKNNRYHRIPLTDEAHEVIALAKTSDNQTLLFPTHTGKAMSDATMSRFMEREGYEARPHGFRATFRTWVEETTDTPYEVKESALAHQVGSETERAYQRSDLLQKRRLLQNQWVEYLRSLM